MNKGLKSYTTQFTQKVGTATASVNLNKNDANLHIILPLLSTKGLGTFSASLIYNYQDNAQNGIFGKGFKLDCFSKITEANDKIEIQNADGSVDTYSEGATNLETQLTVKKVYDDSYQQSKHFEVEDKSGNKKVYSYLAEYPDKIISKTGETLQFDFVSTNKTISNGNGDVIKFICGANGKVCNVGYYYNGKLFENVDLAYTGDNLTSLVFKNQEGAVVNKIVVEYNTDKIIIIDEISEYRAVFKIDQGCVASIQDGYGISLKGKHTTTINYDTNKTTVTSWDNTFVEYYFDSDGLPLYQMNSDGYVIETQFNSKLKVLEAQSSPFLINSSQKNYFAGKTLEQCSLTNVTRKKVTITDSKWKSILGDTVYEFKHTGNTHGSVILEVPIDCIATDSVTAILWGKQLTNYSENAYVQVEMQIGNRDKDIFAKPVKDDNFELMLLGATCDRTETQVRFYIDMVGEVSIQLGGLQIVKQDFGAFYEYDENNNTTLISRNGENAKASYNETNLIKNSTNADTSYCTYEYNDQGRPVRYTSMYGVEIVNEYNDKYPSRIVKQTFSSKDGSKIIETERTYTDDGRYVKSEKDELGNTITTEYSNDRISSICDALESITEFTYDEQLGLVKDIILRNKENDELAKATYGYNTKRQLTSVTLKNGSEYQFIYNFRGNITEILLNGQSVFAYEYDENTGNVTLQKNGKFGDGFKFVYDETTNLLTKVIHVDINNNEKEQFAYDYNAQKQLIKVSDGDGNILSAYEYDAEGKVIKVSNDKSSVKYTYDNLGSINNVLRTVEENTIHESFENATRMQSAHPKSLLNSFSANAYLGIFEKDAVLKMGDKELQPTENITSAALGKEGALTYIQLNSNRKLAYQLTDRTVGNYELGCVKFWFKPTSVTSTQYIFGVKGSNGSSYYSVYIQNGKLHLDVQDEYGKATTKLLSSESNVIADKWNFFALNYYLRDDGPAYRANCEFSLTLNTDTQYYTLTDSLRWIDVAPRPVYYIGRKYDGSSTNAFSGKVACLCVNPRWYDSQDLIRQFYNVTSDYIDDCQYIDASSKTLDASETVAFVPSNDISKLFDIYPLHNSVTSIKGNKPTKFKKRYGVVMDKDKSFNYNNAIRRYAYVADGSELAYKFNQNGSGTILMRAYTENSGAKQYLFEGKDENGNTLGLFINTDGELCASCGDVILSSNLIFTPNVWHTVGLSYLREASVSESMADIVAGKYRIFLDGNTVSHVYGRANYTNLEVSIGRKYEEKMTNRCTGFQYESSPLNGQIEMLCASDAFCETSTLNTLMSEIKCITKTNEFDDFGMLKKSCLLVDDYQAMSKTIEYKTRDDKKYISQRIAKETFVIDGSSLTRKYEYDNAGNVTKIDGTMHGKHTYEYDGRGFLEKEDTTEYAYDGNGNITKMGDVELKYDEEGIRDRLVKVGDTSITYDTNNPLNPSVFGNATYTFEGRRLTKYATTDNEFTYKYNEQGLRIEKKSKTNDVTRFVYDGNKLITELAPTYRLDFVYDENNLLYGFIKDSREKYFYVRDFLQNIIGIIDSKGQLVVQYDQTAYGKVTVLKDTVGIANINPFRYKGYYYDQESGMYYCHTRYYVPEWGRWLNADSIQYVQFADSRNVCLFAFCNNDPVLGYDPDGTLNWGAVGKIFLSVVIVATLAVAAVMTAGTAVGVIMAGAAIGAGLGLATGVANGIVEGAETGDYLGAIADNALSGTIMGGLSGALAASGYGVGIQVLGNMAICGGEYLISSLAYEETPTLIGFISSLGTGVVAGLAGGNGYLMGQELLLRSFARESVRHVVNLLEPLIASSLAGLIKTFIDGFVG